MYTIYLFLEWNSCTCLCRNVQDIDQGLCKSAEMKTDHFLTFLDWFALRCLGWPELHLWSASALFGRKCDRAHQRIQPHYGSGQGEVWFLHRPGVGHQLQHLHRRQFYPQEERTSAPGKEGIDAGRYWPFSECLMHLTADLMPTNKLSNFVSRVMALLAPVAQHWKSAK